jgi:EAL domain-containing protein (putative c-di-GMP-specific phosphodiesterase class I)/GGDEF domain-containing protein
MVEKIVSRIVPDGYAYRDSWWFSEMGKKNEKNRKRTLYVVYAAGTVLPACFLVPSLLAGLFPTPAACVLSAISLCTAAMMCIRPSMKIVPYAVLFSSAAVSLSCFAVSGAGDLPFALFLLFPLFAHQLKGSRRGTLLSVFFLAAAACVMYFFFPGGMTTVRILLRGGVFCLALGISFVIQLHLEGYISDAVEKILYDDATRLPNRTVLMKSIPGRGRSLFSILHIENFADLGVLFGYELSDKILEHITACLQEICGAYGFHIYKLKGHEFGILLNDWILDEFRSEVAIHSVCTALQNMPIVWDNKELRVFVRAGCVIVDDMTRDDFISRADVALRLGEKQHRPVTVYTESMSLVSSVCCSNELYSVLVTNRNTNSFKVYFQPVVDASTFTVMWHECLLRVKGTDDAYHSPLPYLAVAKSTGFDRYITEYVIGEACEAIERTGGAFSINMSYSDILRPEVIDIICEKRAAVSNTDGSLIIEILEGEEIESTELLRSNISRLKKAGCRIAIDDFGSGYSNFAKLVELDVDIIKIDGSLVQKCADDKATESLIRGIAHFCRQWGKEVVAEYVDCEHLAVKMQGMGVDYLQGYHYGIPGASLKSA